jgi:hypothetical protein
MGYAVNYRLDFCDRFENKCRIDILRKDYTGLVIPFIGASEPISYRYKNENEDKLNQITTSEATVRIISNQNIDLNTFFTDNSDERTWLINYHSGSFVANNWDDTRFWDDYTAWEEFTPNEDGSELKWCGFVMPDSSSEPFLHQYEFEIKAKDILGTLKDIPYSNDTVLIKKIDNFKNILGECLYRTDLGLNYIIGVNTFEKSMFYDDAFACPLQQAFIDTNVFIDTNNQPFSVFDVIKHICNQFTANIKQANGKWYFIDITENARGTFRTREYNGSPVGGFYKVGPGTLNTSKTVLPQELVNKDHTFTKEPAYQTVSTYYKYGYITNQLSNGNFNVVNPAPLLQPFPGWTTFGGLQVNYGQKKQLTPNGDVLINDYYLIINNNDTAKGIESDPVTVLKTNTVTVSAFFQFNYNSGQQPVPDKHRLLMLLRLKAPGQPDKYWNRYANAWQDTNTLGTLIAFDIDWLDYISKGTTVNFNVSYPDWDGTITLLIIGVVSAEDNHPSSAIVDDVKINVDENENYKSPIGDVVQLTNVGNYSKSPAPTILLFGDDTHKNRTSWMRTRPETEMIPTEVWFRGSNIIGTAPVEAAPLQIIVAQNTLSQHRASSLRFEGSLRGNFSPLDTLIFPFHEGEKFMFISGTFNVKSSTASVVMSQIFEGQYANYNPIRFEDFGDFNKDKAIK